MPHEVIGVEWFAPALRRGGEGSVVQIGPIDGRGGWLQNLLDRIRPDDTVNGGTGPTPQSPLAPSNPNGSLIPGTGSLLAPNVPGAGLLRPAEISAGNVNDQLSQMVRFIGESLQQDQFLQALVGLMILLSMMQQQQSDTASALMDMLSQSSRFGGGSWSITLESTHTQSITVRSDYGESPRGATGSSQLDACA